VETECCAAKLLHAVHGEARLPIVGAPLCKSDECFNIPDDLAHKAEGIGFIIAESGILLIDQPVVNLILAHDCVTTRIFDQGANTRSSPGTIDPQFYYLFELGIK
jgi:hypothetical protein